MDTLLKNTEIMCIVMAVVIFGLTQVVKLPIKALTNKISNERVRRIVNIVILLIPFALGLLGEYLYGCLYLQNTYSIINGLGYGTAGVSLYGVVERFFKVKTDNPYTTEDGQAVTGLVDSVSKDGKVDQSDLTAVQEFWDKVNK